jgi:N-acetylneuraminic acid mutarotase
MQSGPARAWVHLAIVSLALGLAGLSGCSDEAPAPGPGTWSGRASLSLGPRQEMGVASVGGQIYVVGGFDAAGAPVASVEAYDPGEDRWSQRASMPAALHHVNLAAVGDRLYVVGALSGAGFTAVGTTLAYDPAADQWMPLASMPSGTERGASGVAVVGTRIYVAGGLRGDSVADFSAYDTATNSWEALPSISVARDHLAAATLQGRVYAVAGRDNGDLRGALEAFDPATGAWTSRAAIPTARGGCAAAELSGRLVVMGGEGNDADLNGIFHQTESYDPATDRWTTNAPMRTGRHGIGAAVVNDVLYVPGGASQAGFGAVAVHEAFVF